MEPPQILKNAIKAVPAVKYALGVAGIVAVVAIIGGFRIDYRIAVFGALFVFIGMALLVVFANVAGLPGTRLRTPAIVMVWFSLVMLMLTTFCLFTCVFFAWPQDLVDWLKPNNNHLNGGAGTSPESEWNYFGEPEVAGEFVVVGATPSSFEVAQTLRDDLARLSSLAKELAPGKLSDPNRFGGTYNGLLLFAKSDTQIVRSLREPGKWEAVIDLVSNARVNRDGVSRTLETQDNADDKLRGIKDEFGLDVSGYLLGAIPQDERQREFKDLAQRLWDEYFADATAEKYSITEYESIYGHRLENVARKENG